MKSFYSAIAFILVGVLVGGGVFLLTSKSAPNVGGFLTSTVTSTSSTIGLASTAVIAAGANLQRLHILNTGATAAWCSFGTAALSGEGLRVFGSSSDYLATDITDANLLGKTMNCLSSATTTFSVLRY